MKKSKFLEEQIIAILGQATAGKPVDELCREHKISTYTFYKWKKKFSGMQAADARRLRELEAENMKLKTASPRLHRSGDLPQKRGYIWASATSRPHLFGLFQHGLKIRDLIEVILTNLVDGLLRAMLHDAQHQPRDHIVLRNLAA